jgi:hypothetical protein
MTSSYLALVSRDISTNGRRKSTNNMRKKSGWTHRPRNSPGRQSARIQMIAPILITVTSLS